jgi:hypothetical protein
MTTPAERCHFGRRNHQLLLLCSFTTNYRPENSYFRLRTCKKSCCNFHFLSITPVVFRHLPPRFSFYFWSTRHLQWVNGNAIILLIPDYTRYRRPGGNPTPPLQQRLQTLPAAAAQKSRGAAEGDEARVPRLTTGGAERFFTPLLLQPGS